ncbi:hypothetical protein NITMOv2_3414 [Nitrospira moscoviensis]|uniref:Porin n=2 Tax=Nitrospira moscoviensis TaxID=42253 RepID=A0A0K2GFS7_NITMO|nr:hypothetical protein NITMOv2_3414 [Nitrospira moscoviensis]
MEGKAEIQPDMRSVNGVSQLPTLPTEFGRGEALEIGRPESGAASRMLTASVVPLTIRDSESLAIIPPRFDQQFGGAGATGTSGQTTFGVFGLQVVPAITISGRYDSNVFFTPAIQGVRREDYATSVTPQLFVRDNGRYVSTLMQIGATGEYFTVHPGLSYVGFNGAVNFTFDNIVRRWVQGASLYVSNFTNYTPTPPSFLTAGSGAYSPLAEQGEAQLSIEDTYIRGFQLQRVNTLTNQSTIGGLYPVSSTTNLVAAYSYAFINFGRQYQSDFSPGLFDNVQHTGRIGLSHRLTAQDTILFQYAYNRDIFSSAGSGNFETHGGTVAWTRSYSPALRSTLSGGASLVNQEFAGGTQSNWVYTAAASLNWTRGLDSVTLTYSGGVYPSFVANAGPIFSNLVAATLTHRFRDNVVGGVGANYSSNKSIEDSSSQPGLNFESKTANAWVNYRLTQSTFLWLTYNWGLFSGNYADPNQTQIFARNEVILSLSQYWR